MSPTAPFLPTAEEMGERTPAETAFLHFLSALYRLSMQSCAPTQSAFSYPLSFRRLCQHNFPLPLPVATVNAFVLSCYGTTNISHHPVPAGHTYPLRCFAPQWARFDNRHSTSAPAPTLAVVSGSGARGTSSPLNRQCYPPHFMRECIPPNLHDPQRAKGSLDRRFEWFSLVTFF